MRKLNSLFSLAVLLSLFFCWGPTATAQRGPKVMPSQGYQLPAQKGIRTVQDLRDPIPAGMARIILEAHNVWNDGTGYQMLWDADHNEYGASIPTLESNSWTFASGSIPAGLFDPFEYKVPANADASFTPTNFVLDGTATVDIPAGTYDYVIINPNPGILYIVGQGVARADDYAVEAGKTYHFTVSRLGTGDNAEVVVTGGGDTPNFNPVQNLTGSADGNKVTLNWTAPNGSGPGPDPDPTTAFTETFNNVDMGGASYTLELPTGWTSIDADGDGNNWFIFGGNQGHNGGNTATSGSWMNVPLTPDNYLVTPELNLPNGGTLKFWVCAQDGNYPADHYAVYASTSGNAATNFVTALLEETLSSKTAHVPDAPRGSRAQGTWTQKTVQLPAGTKYVAFRHYNCTDAFRINIDDIEITATAKGRSVNGAREMVLLSITDAPELLRSGEAEIVLEAHDVWNDGSGYQIVLDADHTAFGQEIPAVGNFTNNCDVPADFFAPFEYTVPENADPSCSPTNMVVDGTATVKIPAGVYDYAIAAPQAGVRIWIAGGDNSRADDYNFEAGKKYHFLMQKMGMGDGSELTISGGGSTADYTYTVYRDGAMIKDGLTATTFSEENVAAGTHNYCVEVKYTAGVSPKECVDVTVPGGVLNPVTNLTAEKNGDDVVLKWTAPNGTTPNPNPGETALEEGFESGIPATWKTIDADGDGNNWTDQMSAIFSGHTGLCVSSASYINNVGPQTPDNYLVTPELNLPNGGKLTFWVCGQDADYAAEHYAVYASSTGNEAVNFSNALLEETLTAKSVVTAPEAIRGTRAQGTWYEKTVQLPAGTKYVAFRHFDVTDQFWINLDDVVITDEGGGGDDPADYTYTVYRDGNKIKEGLTATTYTDAGQANANHEYCVEVKYAAGVSPKVCVTFTDLNDVVAAKPYTITVVGKTITVTCEGTAMIYDMTGRRLASGRNTVVYTAQGGFYAAMIVVDGKSYVEKLAIK